MGINGKAVEAVAEVLYARDVSNGRTPVEYPLWEYFKEAKEIIKTATPFIAAQVWDEGAVAGWKQSGEGFNAEYPDESTGACSADLSANPYRNAE